MPHLQAKSLKQLGEEVDFLSNQLDRLTDEVVKLRREHRADRDRQTLELETIKEFLLEAHPEMRERFLEIREGVRLGVSPE